MNDFSIYQSMKTKNSTKIESIFFKTDKKNNFEAVFSSKLNEPKRSFDHADTKKILDKKEAFEKARKEKSQTTSSNESFSEIEDKEKEVKKTSENVSLEIDAFMKALEALTYDQVTPLQNVEATNHIELKAQLDSLLELKDSVGGICDLIKSIESLITENQSNLGLTNNMSSIEEIRRIAKELLIALEQDTELKEIKANADPMVKHKTLEIEDSVENSFTTQPIALKSTQSKGLNEKNMNDISKEIHLNQNVEDDKKAVHGYRSAVHEKSHYAEQEITDSKTMKPTSNWDFKSQNIITNDKTSQDYLINQNIAPLNDNPSDYMVIENKYVPKANFHSILEQLVDRAEVLVREDNSEMTLSLKPDNLGKLSMKIAVEKGIVIATIVAENQAVKETIESNFNLLKDALNQKGFGIQELNVSVGQDSNLKEQQSYMFSKRQKNSNSTMADISDGIHGIEERFQGSSLLSMSKLDFFA